MYIVAIAWLYVVILMAATESSLTAAVLTFFFYGLAPLALFLWLVGTPQRRRNRAQREAATMSPASMPRASMPVSEHADTGDHRHP
jgi:hypothetical protein